MGCTDTHLKADEEMNSDHKLRLKMPTSWWGNMWREALPSGNGELGAAVYGGVKEETIMITHENLWHWGRKDPLPDVSYTLPIVRELMDKRQYHEASWLLTNTLQEQGYASRLASKFPVADLRLSMKCSHAFKGYERSLDMATGQVSVSWRDGATKYSRNLFVSRADQAIVYEVKTDGAPIEANLRLAFHPTEAPNEWAEACKELEATTEWFVDGEYMYYAGRNDDGTDFGVVARVIASRGNGHAGEDNTGAVRSEGNPLASEGGAQGNFRKPASIQIANADYVLVLLKVFVSSEKHTAWKQLQQELANLNPNYKKLLASHAKLHGDLYHSVQLQLGEGGDQRSNEELLLSAYEGEAPLSLTQKMWAYGRYLLISGVRTEGQPFGLYGLWGGDYRLTWDHHMANINIQMMYWHAAAGGLIELLQTMINYYESMMDDFRENARKLYGCRGIYIPAGSTPGIGVPNQIVPVIMNWTGGAGWIAQHYYEYYLYTGDIKLLSEKLLPFMREVALFYEDFLVLEESGYYKYYPSVSPENSPQNYMGDDLQPLNHPMPTTINATSDFAIMKELLTNLIEGSSVAGLYSDEIEKWQEMLQRIPPYMINEDGAIREWMHEDFDDRYEHRHLSHTYPIFPGREFTREEQPELFQAFERAVMLREIGAQSGWSLMYMAAIYARLGEGNSALECLDLLARSSLLNNFYTLHNDWRNMGVCLEMEEAPVQFDANMGWSHAVQEMLLYQSARSIKLLPALPDRWQSGSVRNLRVYTGKLSMSWNTVIGHFSAQLTAERDTNILIYLPPMFTAASCKKSDNEQVHWSRSAIAEHAYEVSLKAGQSLIIS